MIRASIQAGNATGKLRARALRIVATQLVQRRRNDTQKRSDWRSATRLWPDFGAD